MRLKFRNIFKIYIFTYSKCSFICICENNSTENHEIIEWFELEGIFKVCLLRLCAYAQGHFSIGHITHMSHLPSPQTLSGMEHSQGNQFECLTTSQ